MKTTAAEKVKRDALVVSDRARGFRWATIAERRGLSETQCRNIWRARGTAAWRDVDAVEAVDEILTQLESVIEELAELAASTRNDAVKLGAVKARAAAIVQRLEILQALRRLPALPRVATELDIDGITEALFAVVDKHSLARPVVNDFVAALRGESLGVETPTRRLVFTNGN